MPTGETCGNCPADCGPCQIKSNVYTCVENNVFAMTFDDGPTADVTTNIMSILASNNIKATFLTVGTMVGYNPGVLAAEIAAGHSTHSHTHTHTSLATLTQQGVYTELVNTEAAYAAAGVCRRPTLVRPPYGDINANAEDVLRKMGYRAIMWNVDSNDWRQGDPSNQYTAARVMEEFRQQMDAVTPSGVLALEHDLFQYSADVLPDIVSDVQSRGYSFVSVDRCLWGANYQHHPSYVHANRFCPQSVAGWPSVTASHSCPVSDWSDWSDCDANCGSGTQTRVRLTLPPSLKQTSAACGSVPLFESRVCTAATATCPTTGCEFGSWTKWGSCSATCGGGTQIRTRAVSSGGSSCGPVLQTQLCNMHACVNRRALRGEQ